MLVWVLIVRQGAPEGPDDIDATVAFRAFVGQYVGASSSPLLRLHACASVTLASLDC
jgi:hypothetical protein